jgi:hypothetical protein
VTCHLPLTNAAEEKAVNKVIGYLERQRKERIGVQGFTRSSLKSPVFRGYWWSSGRRRWVRENIVLFIIDYKLDFDDERVSVKVAELQGEVQRWYEHYTGKPQDVVWVVAHSVVRHE